MNKVQLKVETEHSQEVPQVEQKFDWKSPVVIGGGIGVALLVVSAVVYGVIRYRSSGDSHKDGSKL